MLYYVVKVVVVNHEHIWRNFYGSKKIVLYKCESLKMVSVSLHALYICAAF